MRMRRLSGSTKKDKRIVEIPIAEEIASLNLNEATRVNAGNPYFDEQLRKNAPGWAKVLFAAVAIVVVGTLAIAFVGALLYHV